MGEGEGLLATSPSSPTPRDLRRRLPIRSLNPRPPAAAEEEEEGEAPGSSSAAAPARKEMERRTESNSSWNPPPPPPAASSRSGRMVCPSAARSGRRSGIGSSGGEFGGIWLVISLGFVSVLRRGSATAIFKILGSARWGGGVGRK